MINNVVLKKLAKNLFSLIPARTPLLLRVAHRYIDRANGDNNSDPETNGEYFFLRTQLPIIKGVIFDVGANVGHWTAFALQVNPNLELHCFEPSKITYAKLDGKNWPANIRLNNFGLSEESGEAELNIFDEGSGMNSLYFRGGGVSTIKEKGKEKIQLKTVDKYCQENEISQIQMLKVDVEGHELAVFKGMTNMLKAGKIRLIQFEYGGCNLDSRVPLMDIWHFLEPYGFYFYKLFPDGPKRVEQYSQDLDNFRYSNWLAIQKGQSK